MAAPEEEDASYIDYETFLAPEFEPSTFANQLVLGTNNANDLPLDLSTPLSKVLFDAQEIDSHIDQLTTRSAIPLLTHTKTQTDASTRILSEIDGQILSLNESYKQLEKEVIEKHAEADQVRHVATRLWDTLKLARSVGRCLQLGRQLEVQHTEISAASSSSSSTSGGSGGNRKEDHRALLRCANTIVSLREILERKAPGEEGYGLDRVHTIKSLQDAVIVPVERSIRTTSEQMIREFSVGTAAGSSTFAQSEETKSRTVSAMNALYLISPTTGSTHSSGKWTPVLLLQALEGYLRQCLASSLASLARSLAQLPTLDRTLAEVSARCQNIVALEALLDATRAPAHPLVLATAHHKSAGGGGEIGSSSSGNLLQPFLTYLETGSLASHFWRTLASALSPRVQEILNRGGVSARTLRSNKSGVSDAIRECVMNGSQSTTNSAAAATKTSTSTNSKSDGKGGESRSWDREVAVMVGSVVGNLGR